MKLILIFRAKYWIYFDSIVKYVLYSYWRDFYE